VLPGLKLGRVREIEDRLKARIAGLLDKADSMPVLDRDSTDSMPVLD
jgi:hypothetical protein